MFALREKRPTPIQLTPDQRNLIEIGIHEIINAVVFITEILKISPETVKRDWRFAGSWLLRELASGD